jgi:hypothetical protein
MFAVSVAVELELVELPLLVEPLLLDPLEAVDPVELVVPPVVHLPVLLSQIWPAPVQAGLHCFPAPVPPLQLLPLSEQVYAHCEFSITCTFLNNPNCRAHQLAELVHSL